MIVTCDACSKKYQIDETSFKNGRRRVRCAACGHEWTVTAVPLETETELAPEKISRKKPWILFGIACAVILGSVIVLGPVTHLVPAFGTLFGIQEKPLFTIEGVTCTPRLEGDKTFVIVQGTVRNGKKKPLSIPPLKIRLYGKEAQVDAHGVCQKDCHPIEWTEAAPKGPVAPGGHQTFESKSPQPVLEDIGGCHVGF